MTRPMPWLTRVGSPLPCSPISYLEPATIRDEKWIFQTSLRFLSSCRVMKNLTYLTKLPKNASRTVEPEFVFPPDPIGHQLPPPPPLPILNVIHLSHLNLRTSQPECSPNLPLANQDIKPLIREFFGLGFLPHNLTSPVPAHPTMPGRYPSTLGLRSLHRQGCTPAPIAVQPK